MIFAKWRRWNREHREAWNGFTEPGPDGLSRFQRECEAALLAAGAEPVSVEPFGENAAVILMKAGAADLWITPDGAQLGDDVQLEEWDALTPAELIETVVAKARR